MRNLNSNWLLSFIILVVFLFNNKTTAQTTPEVITSGSSSWTSPAGITSFTVEVWGGGGAGGGCQADTRRRGGSGGTGGTYVRNTYSPAGPTSYNYVVGAARAGTNNANGANGNFSWFSGVGTQYATGGLGGRQGNGAAVTGSSTGSIGTIIFAGGNTLAGVGGAGSTIGSAGSAGANGGGAGGGINTAGTGTGSIAGFNGTAPGGGGGGASTQLNNGTFPDVPGGTGERGEIRITYLHINGLGNTLGCLGSTITINGTDFTGATAASITIGGTPVSSIVSNTGTQIVAVVGAGTTGTVTITIAGKGTTTSSQTFTVETPVDSGNPTSNSPQCLSTGVTLTRSGSVPVGETWYWQTVSGGTSTTSNAATYVAPTSGTYYIRARNNTSLCWSTGEGSITVVVNALPVNPSNPTSDSPQCLPSVVTITSVGTSPVGETWYWQTVSGGTATSSSGVTYSTSTSGTYYIRSQNNTTGCWSAGEGNVTIVVTALPNNPGNPTSNSPQCLSTGVTLTRSGSVPVGETWYWQTVSGGTSTTSNAATYVAPTSGTYYIRARNNTSLCWSTGEGSITVVVNALPVNPSNPTSDSPQCFSPGVTITRSGFVPAGETWFWQTVSGGTSTTNSAATYVVTTSGTYYIRAQNNTTGCWSASEGSLTVVVNALPANPGNPTSNSPQCLPTGVTITRSGNPAAGITWYWQTVIGGTSTTNNATSSYVVTTSGTYYIRAQNNTTGCWSAASGSLTVIVNALPANPGNPTSDSPQCASPGVTLTRVGSPPAGETWYWQTISGGTSTTNSAATYVVTTSGTYYIRSRNNTTLCWSSGEGSLAVIVNVLPANPGNPTSNSPQCLPTGVTITRAGNPAAGITWYWQTVIGGTSTTNNATSSYVVTTSGTYYIRAQNNTTGCWSAASGSLTVVVNPVPVTPGNPTTLNLTTVSATSISGAFTAASPAPNGYLIVRSSVVTPPTLTDGTTYAAGSTVLTPGTTYVVQGSATTSNAVTFTDTGLTANTKYFYHIISYNDTCSGAPFYNTTTLTNNANTCPNVPNSLSASGLTTNAFNFNWAVPTGGTVIALTYTVQITTDAGFTANITGSPFTINSPTVTLGVTGLNPATTYYVRIRAGNGTCNSAYVSGFIITKPINDECSSATPLTVSTNCSYTTSSNNGATNSTGVPAPGCASYSGGDVWFSAVVPANGVMIISSQAGVIIDGGMAAYSGTCGGTLTLIGCDDDSAFEAMPSLTLTSLIPGNTIWIRFWEYGNNNNGTFGICVTTPCDNGPATGTTTLLCTTPIAGGLGLSGVDPATVTCVSAASCVDLEATYPVLKSTTNYDVTAIPYAPPYQFNCLRNPVSVNVDDVWSPVITLPFNFCFYGNSYTQCVMGSNGIISFNTALASSGSGFQYNNSLPSTVGSLFANSIYGVYHDIDPSVGGEVGWELITLNTGCRALVAGWSDVPMYSDKSILYTGMMVLYENSNVIEVYIKEKKIDRYSGFYGDAWNYGNGIVGVQNAAANAAVVAPGRNGLDANWTATNEAWRFTPSGANIATIKWYQGSGTGGTVVGTTPTINVCPTATTTYTAEISYALCNGTTLKQTDETVVTINKNKVWNGSVDADWDKDANWTPSGKPTAVNCITIPDVLTVDPVISSGSYNAFGHNITIQSGGFLQINPTSNVTITDAVAVNAGGTFSLKNSASLIQINNSAINSGSITMERLTNIRRTDYVYWSSPVENFSSSAISLGTSSNYIYKWNPSITNANNGQGNWASGIETMVAGKGYIVRGPDSYTSSPANYTATFTGKAQNGIISPSITRGDITSVAGAFPAAPYVGTNGVTITERNDNWNLMGNPYPSAISALNFLSLNAVTNNRIVGNVRLWTHGTDVSQANLNSFYATYGYNYSATDYINYNGTGPAIPGFDGLIGAGQGFFVLMNEAPTPQTSSVTFQNSMRSNTFRNDQFYRQDNHTQSANDLNTIARNRIWLSLVNSASVANTTLVGYVDGATLGEDVLFDAPHFITPASSIYSLTQDKPWIIQGRPTPFDVNDIVPMGVVIPSNDIYNIALSEVDGLFDNTAQGIYIEDTSLGIIHDLRASPYSFTAVTGVYNSRFKLRYTTVSLGIDNPDANQTFAFINNNQLHIQSNDAIKEIILYDITGKLIKTYQPNEVRNQFVTDFFFANGAYIAKIKLESGIIVSRKLLH